VYDFRRFINKISEIKNAECHGRFDRISDLNVKTSKMYYAEMVYYDIINYRKEKNKQTTTVSRCNANRTVSGDGAKKQK